VRRNHVQSKRRGRRLVFRREWLDAALDRCTDEQRAQRDERLDRMAALARQHARSDNVRLM
jgi:hypothetical protein